MQSLLANCLHPKNWVLALFLIVLTSSRASADLITFVDGSSFEAAGDPVALIDFESASPGTIGNGDSQSGITFSYDFGGVDLIVDDVFDTTSGTNYLGTNDGGLLQDGDDLTFSFFSPVGGFGLYIISQEPLLDGDFTLTVGTITASLLAASIQEVLGDGSSVWFLGIRSNGVDSFSSAVLATHGGGGSFLYNLDDLVISNVSAVPEPTSVLFVLTAATMFARRRFRHLRTQRKLA